MVQVSYKLWIDDQLGDPETPTRHTPEGWVGAASVEEAVAIVETYGYPPEEMDLDHDLGPNETVMEFLSWLSWEYIDVIPRYKIHSMNPVGVERITSFMESWKRAWQKQ